jgi:hypothetical protein
MATVQEMIKDNQIGQDDLNRAYTSWYKPTKDSAEKAMKANPNWSNNFNEKKNIAAREMFAGATGKIDEAFTEKYDQYSPEAAYGLEGQAGVNKKSAKKYIQGLSAKELGSIPLSYSRTTEEEIDGKKVTLSETVNNEESLRLIGEHVLASQLGSIRNELNGAQKILIIEGVQRSGSQETKDFIEDSPAWAHNLKKMQKNMESIGSTLKSTGQKQVEIAKSQDEKLKKISNQPNRT